VWHDFYKFWVTQQTLPGNILGDVLIAGGAIIIGKVKVLPWLQKMHDQRERHHQELLDSHKKLLESHQKLRESHQKLLESHQELIDVQRQSLGLPPTDARSTDARPTTPVE
jgi:hypothetical protein